MNRRTMFIMSAATVFTVGGLAIAQTTGQTGQTGQRPGQRIESGQTQTQSQSLLRASQIMGKNVKAKDGQEIGEIDNLAVDFKNEKLSFVILDLGASGTEDKMVAVPFEAFNITSAQLEQDQPIMVNVDRAKFQNAPSFDQNNWANLSNEQWTRTVYTHFGVQPPSATGDMDRMPPRGTGTTGGAGGMDDEEDSNYPSQQGNPGGAAGGEAGGATGGAMGGASGQTGTTTGGATGQTGTAAKHMNVKKVCKASDFIGVDVKNNQQEDLGEIDDLLVQANSGHIVYAVLSSGGFLGMGEKLHAVPLQAFNVRMDQGNRELEELVINVDRDRLRQAPTFESDNYPTTLDPQFSRQVFAFYGAEQPDWVYGYTGEDDDQGMRGGAAGGSAWSSNDAYMRLYDPQDMQTVQGRITEMRTFTPAAGKQQGKALVIQDQGNRNVVVHLGPEQFMSRQNWQLNSGQEVTVIGSKATFQGEEVIIAKEIRKDGQTYRLRDEQGKPVWQTSQSGGSSSSGTSGRPGASGG